MQVPPALAEAAVLDSTSEIVRRVEIYEADATTRWAGGANDDRLLGGSVTVDYSRDERRAVDLELDNTDFGLEHTPEKFWYDKILKVFSGVRYIDTTPIVTPVTRQNDLLNPRFKQNGSVVAETRRNLFINPTMSVNTSNWASNTNSQGTVTLSRQTVGGPVVNGVTLCYARLTWNTVTGSTVTSTGIFMGLSGSDSIPVIAGQPLSISALARCNVLTRTARLVLTFVDSTGTTVGGGANGAIVTIGGSTWTPLILENITVPTGATRAVCRVYAQDAGSWTVNDTLDVAAGMFEHASVAMPYFDGDSVTDAAIGWATRWLGTPGASASVEEAPSIVNNVAPYIATAGIAGGRMNGDALRIIAKQPLATSNIIGFQYDANNVGVSGGYAAMRLQARIASGSADVPVSFRISFYAPSFVNIMDFVATTLPVSGAWQDINVPSASAAGATTSTPSYRVMIYANGAIPAGTIFEIRQVIVDDVPATGMSVGAYMDGSTQAFGNRTYAWAGAADASSSIETVMTETPQAVSTVWETQVGEFMIDSISEDHFPYTVKVVGRDYTKKCLQSKFVVATALVKNTAIETAIKTLAQNAGITKFILPTTGKSLGTDYYFERGVSRWEAMKQISDAFGYELFFDAQGYLVMREYLDPITAPLSYTLETGAFGTLVSYNKTVNDTRIYNHIVVTGETNDNTVLPVYATAENHEPSSPTRIEKIGDRVYQYSSAFITTTLQAQDVATKFLKIHGLEEFDLNFSAISLFWLEVGEIVEFEDPRPSAGQPKRFLLSSINLPLDLGAMSGNAKRVSVVG